MKLGYIDVQKLRVFYFIILHISHLHWKLYSINSNLKATNARELLTTTVSAKYIIKFPTYFSSHMKNSFA